MSFGLKNEKFESGIKVHNLELGGKEDIIFIFPRIGINADSGARRISFRGGGGGGDGVLTLHACHDRCCAGPDKVAEWGLRPPPLFFFIPSSKNLGQFSRHGVGVSLIVLPTSLSKQASKQASKKVLRIQGGGGYPADTPQKRFRIQRGGFKPHPIVRA